MQGHSIEGVIGDDDDSSGVGLDRDVTGRGILLVTDVTETFDLARGERLYFAAENVNRISIIIAPIPWQQAIALAIEQNTFAVQSGFQLVKKLGAALLGKVL